MKIADAVEARHACRQAKFGKDSQTCTYGMHLVAITFNNCLAKVHNSVMYITGQSVNISQIQNMI